MHAAHQALLADVHSISPIGVMLKYIDHQWLMHTSDVHICLVGCLMHRLDQALMHNILPMSTCGRLICDALLCWLQCASVDHAFHAAHCIQEHVTVHHI